jgi:hypothetical protein
MSADEAVILVKQEIKDRDEDAIKIAKHTNQIRPYFVGKD